MVNFQGKILHKGDGEEMSWHDLKTVRNQKKNIFLTENKKQN